MFQEYGVQYAGQDWLQDEDGEFHFLEINSGPGLEIFNTLYNRGEGDEETAGVLLQKR